MLIPNTDMSFAQHVNTIIDKLTESPHWNDKLRSSMTTVLADAYAGIATNNQYYIDFAAREAFTQLAKRDSSIYAGARFLGVKINRRQSASTTVLFTNTNDVDSMLNAYETFTIYGKTFFIRDTLILNPGEQREVPVYAGVPSIQRFDLSNYGDLSLLQIKLGRPGFVVADNDLSVYVEDKTTGRRIEWRNHEGSIFELTASDTAFMESTDEDGDVILMFGDNNAGMIPASNSIIEVRYVESNGDKDNGSLPGETFSWAKDRTVVGETIEAVNGGSGIKDITFYKNNAPRLYQAKKRMVSKPDFESGIKDFPEIADAVVLGQRDIAPGDPNWRNVIRVCALPQNGSTLGGANPHPTSAAWDEVIRKIQERCSPRITIQTWNPIKLAIDIWIVVAVENDIDTDEMESTLTKAILKLFSHTENTLGKKVTLSDLMDTIKFSDDDSDVRRKGIDYIDIKKPTEDITPASKLEYVGIKSLNIKVKHTER